MMGQRYILEEELGAGGMGEVYRAYDRLMNQTVALKRVLVPPDHLQFNTRTDDLDLMLALAREFKALASLRHPNIISVLDYGFTEQRIPFFTMEYLAKPISILNAGFQIDTHGRINLIMQLLEGLAYLHQRGLIHRDLKPANVMVVDEQVKIIDFGLAIEPNQSKSTAGTLTYLAPELLSGGIPSFASDLYAVGLMTYQLFLRKYPFDTSQFIRGLINDIVNKPIDCAELPNEIRPVIENLLAKDPSERYASAYGTMVALSQTSHHPLPPETATIRESFLQASRFVGRTDELNSLKSDCHNMIAGMPSFHLIGGESGVGKSRLVEELRTYALVEGVLVIRGQAVSGVGLPFQIWRDIARRLLISTDIEDAQASILKDIVPDISQLLERPIPDAPELSGKPYQNRLIGALINLIKAVQQPLLLILEDLQWTVESLLPLQQMLNTQDQFAKMMVVGTYRNDERPDLPTELPDMNVLTLERLDNTAIAQLSAAMLGDAGKQPQIVEFLEQETEGNTFFMVEIVRTLAEEVGRLQDISVTDLRAQILTGGMHQMLRKRLVKIEPEYQPLLEFAALAGRLVDENLLNQILPNLDLQDWLYQCEIALVLQVQDDQWLFAHDKLREAVLADLEPDTLPDMHRQIAEGLEAVYPDQTAYDEVLLNHWQQAGDLNKEIWYLERVAHQLTETGENFTRAKTLLAEGLTQLADDDQRRIKLLNTYIFALWKLGEYDEVQRIGHDILELAEQYNDDASKAECLRIMGMTVRRLGNYLDGKAYYEQALAYAEALDDKDSMGSIYNSLGLIYLHLGDPELTMDAFEKSVDFYREAGNDMGLGLTLNSMGMEFARQKDYPKSYACLEEGLHINQHLNNQWGVASAYNNIGLVATWEKDFAKAESYTLECLQIFKSMGTRHEIANSQANLAHIQLLLGNEAVRETLHNGLALAYQIQAIPIVLELLACWSWWLYKQGDVQASAELVGFVKEHPAHNIEVDEKLGEVLPLLHQTFTADEFKAHYQRGSQLEIDSLINNLLTKAPPPFAEV